MLSRFLPKEVNFFALFNAHAQQTSQGADALMSLMQTLNDSPDAAAEHATAVDVIEERADKITHEVIGLLHSTFITPLDRDEIHQLISRLDDVLDTIQDAAQTVSMYDIRQATPEMLSLTVLIQDAVAHLVKAVTLLDNMKNASEILAACRQVDRCESEADQVLREAMSKLFREELDVRELIKLKAIYELLETVTDRCDDVGNILEAIVLENA